jgi:enoyl-CoA hydratase/carnithine racemase
VTAIGQTNPPVLVHELDGVYTVELNRPAQRNALIWESWEGLGHALHTAVRDPKAKAVVLAGSGPFFCSGGDRKTPPRHGNRALAPAARLELAHRILLEISNAPLVVIAAIEGGAIGLGWGLALACDLIVAADDAEFSAPFVSLGLVPDGGTAWHLVRRLGRNRAMQILLSGRKVSAPEAHQLGLVTSICAAGSALSSSHELAGQVAGLDSSAVEFTKRMVASGEQSDYSAYLCHELVIASHVQLSRQESA